MMTRTHYDGNKNNNGVKTANALQKISNNWNMIQPLNSSSAKLQKIVLALLLLLLLLLF